VLCGFGTAASILRMPDAGVGPSVLNLPGHLKSVIDLHTQILNGTRDLAVAQEQLTARRLLVWRCLLGLKRLEVAFDTGGEATSASRFRRMGSTTTTDRT
jgi:hypothetical protein